MRWLNWRRALAMIAMVAGIGVGVSNSPASATPHPNSGGIVHTNGLGDWWWT
jgi:hypothetical protein